MEFQVRTALVTGAAGAIGKGIAAGYLKAGLDVFITDLDQKAVDATVVEIACEGRICKGLAADVTQEDAVKKVVDSASDAFGGSIDILVNVAGIVDQGKVEEIEVDAWDRIFAVNCRGTFLFIKHTVPLMKKAGFGKIINFSSKSGKTGSALMSHYSAAKAAVMGLTQSLAFELAPEHITVNCICPGITDETGVWSRVSSGYIKNLKMDRGEVVKKFTGKIPLKRLATVEDITSVTLFLSSRGADYMTGQSINVTGGREMH